MRYIFGPVNSRRFGLSLGIDLSPEKKSCNFDCLYCELESAKPKNTIDNPPKVEDILKELKESLNRFDDIEVITITSNGEPTLYPYLKELVDEIKKIKKDKKLLILSNGALIYKKEIQNILKEIDIVKLSLDCATKECFKKLDRPLKEISLEKIVEGLKEFSKSFKGSLIIEILVVKGINDKEEEFEKLNEVLKEIKPERVDIGTIDRPPAYKVSPVSYERLFELSKKIENLPVTIAHRNKTYRTNKDMSKEEILRTLKRRPFTLEDIEAIFSKKSLKTFEKLLNEKKIVKKVISNTTFYTTNIDK
ncbi:radical SAM protein [Nitrosophilus labii]|uniref:radical SAM protein n=1 Tax=Nitrosophilus labii TaxID=2706014 RepID=UPI0016570AB0|nr:radical SAM protein [Nitrosophilus labii]